MKMSQSLLAYAGLLSVSVGMSLLSLDEGIEHTVRSPPVATIAVRLFSVGSYEPDGHPVGEVLEAWRGGDSSSSDASMESGVRDDQEQGVR